MLDDIQTILVIDDHPLMRKGIIQLIAMEDSLRLAGEAGDGRQGLELARQLRPDLILLDLNMRGLSGLDTLKALKATDLDARVIILTVSDSEEDVVAALRAGADGYLLKDMEPEDVLNSLRAAARGRMALGEGVGAILADALRHESELRSADNVRLTEREREILSHRRRLQQQADRPRTEDHRGHGEGARQALAAQARPGFASRSGGLGGQKRFPRMSGYQREAGSRRTITGCGVY